MLTKIAENIYRKGVPLPNNPLREINVYIITGERNLVIDTGFNRPECEKALQEAFDELGIIETDLFITHLHSDHCGLICKFAKENSIPCSGRPSFFCRKAQKDRRDRAVRMHAGSGRLL